MARPLGAAMTTIEARSAEDRLSASGVRPERWVRGTDFPRDPGDAIGCESTARSPDLTALASDLLDRTRGT
jgi:hypothetical protein